MLKRHFLKVKKAFDLKKYNYGAFSHRIRYIWAKFEQNRFFSRGRVMFDFCGHPKRILKRFTKCSFINFILYAVQLFGIVSFAD
jgi:hypothetical protein